MTSVLAHAFHDADAFAVPLPVVAIGVAVILLALAAGARRWWTLPPLADDGEREPLSGRSQRLVWLGVWTARVGCLVAFGVVLAAGVWGPGEGSPNLAPLIVLVLAWVGLLLTSALLGELWAFVSPFATLAPLVERVAGRRGPQATDGERPGEWAAPVLLAAFVWLQQAYHDPASPTATTVFVVGYTVMTLVAVAVWGKGWLRYGEGFAALGRAVGAVAPLAWGTDGRVTRRPVLSGLATLQATTATVAVLLIALGAMVFDALLYTPLWIDLVEGRSGWARTAANSAGLGWTIASLAVLFVAGARLAERMGGGARGGISGFAPLLVPLALGLTAAVDGAVAVFTAQLAVALVSDPLAQGWDLFGTADRTVNIGVLISPGAIYLQMAAVVCAGGAAVVATHDRALALLRRAPLQGRDPLMAVAVALTVGPLLVLLVA